MKVMQIRRNMRRAHYMAASSTSPPTELFSIWKQSPTVTTLRGLRAKICCKSLNPRETLSSFWSQWMTVIWLAVDSSPSCRMQSQLFQASAAGPPCHRLFFSKLLLPLLYLPTWTDIITHNPAWQNQMESTPSQPHPLGSWLKCPLQ